MPKISVIVPVYNAVRYLHRCVDSILAQTFTDFELLLINDGSKDNSGRICDEFATKDARVRVFHKKNGGVSSARNLGLDNAKGEYIMFVDSDDYMFPQMCELMKTTMEMKKADMVVCGTTETGGGYWRPVEDKDYTLVLLKENFVELLRTELLSPPWNKIFKHSIIGKLRFYEDISFGEDLMFNLGYICKCGNVSFIKESPFFHEKDNACSLVVKFNRNRLTDIEKVWTTITQFVPCEPSLYNKYYRDIVVSVRQLLRSDNYSWTSKKEILREWHNICHLKELDLSGYNGVKINRILLSLLRHKQWLLSNLLVNIKSYLKF